MRNQVTHKAGLVGAGHICEYHVAALRRLGNVEIVGVTDIDSARATAAAGRLGIPHLPSLAALKAAGAQVIHVLTPPLAHATVALDALGLGCHVLVEKPLAEDVADCDRIAEAARQAGRSVCVNHSLLFDPQVRHALVAVRSGKIGRVVAVDVLRSSVYPPFGGGPLPPQYRAGGYPFRDLGVHALYLLEAFLGPIENVAADWQSLGGDPNLAFDEWIAQVRCRDGSGQIRLSWNVKPVQSQLIIQGTRGVMRVDLFLMFQALRRVTGLPKPAERVINALTDSLRPLIDVPLGVLGFLTGKVLPYHGLQDLVAAFYRALEVGDEPPVSVADAARVVQWTEKIARAADEEARRRAAPFVLSDSVPVLVTGAAGGLGSAVVDALRRRGQRVRIMVRRPPPGAAGPQDLPAGVEAALGDLGDPDAVDRAVRGAAMVIHAGAAMKGGWITHQGSTVAGTQNVIDACLRHGVKKLVHISSLSVVDWAGGAVDSIIDESTPLEPRAEERGHYTRAKLLAERQVSDACRTRGLPAVILRPGQIFGGKLLLLTGAVARRLGKRLIVLGNGRLRLPLIHVDDVVDAILCAADSDLCQGQIIQLVHPDQPTQNQVLQILGQDRRAVHVPRWLLFLLGGLSAAMLRPLKRPSPIAPYRLRSGLARRRFASQNAGLLAGWSPRVEVMPAIAMLNSTTREIRRRTGERRVMAST